MTSVRTIALSAAVLAAGVSVAETTRPDLVMNQVVNSTDTTYRFFPQIQSQVPQTEIAPPNPSGMPRLTGNGVSDFLPTSTVDGSSNIAGNSPQFPGLIQSGYRPPDPSLAVGPASVVMVANSQIGFFSKTTGAKTFGQTLQAFFGSAAQTTFLFDPKCFYDQLSNRFFVVALDANISGGTQISNVLVAVSDDSNPAGVWRRYRVNSKRTISGSVCWFDYPGFGYNKDGVVITGNMFSFGANSFKGSLAITLRKAPMLTGAATTVGYFTTVGGANPSVQVARGLDNTNPRVFGVGHATLSAVNLFSWNNLATTAPTQTKVVKAVPGWAQFVTNVPATGGKQLGSVADRVQDAAFRNTRFVYAHTVNISGRAAIRWVDLNLAAWPTVSVAQAGNITSSSTHLWMPGISRNANGGVGVVFSQSSSTVASRMCRMQHNSTGAAGSMTAFTVVKASTANAVNNPERWGDYQGCASDPFSATKFWVVGEWLTTGGAWRTEITSFLVP